jgi:hypothetical protein
MEDELTKFKKNYECYQKTVGAIRSRTRKALVWAKAKCIYGASFVKRTR